MNYVFYLIPLLLVISIPTAFAQTATSATSATEIIETEIEPFVFENQPYTKPNNLTDEGVGFYEVRNPDGTFTLTTHYDYFEDENGNFMPYRLNQNDSMIQVEVNGGKFVFDKTNGAVTIFDEDEIIVNSDSYVVKSALEGTDVWNNLTTNNEPVTVQVLEKGETLEILFEKENDLGLFRTVNTIYAGELKTDLYFINYSLDNSKISFTETLELPNNTITLNDQVIDLNQFVGMSFDRTTLEQNEDLVLEAKEIMYNAGLGFEYLWQVNIHEDNKISLDYANSETVYNSGDVTWLDPTWNVTGTINGSNVDFNISTLNNASVNSGDIDGTALTSSQITSLQNALNSGTTTWSQPYTAGAIWTATNHSVSSGNPATMTLTQASGDIKSVNTGNNGSIKLSNQSFSGYVDSSLGIKDYGTGHYYYIQYPFSNFVHSNLNGGQVNHYNLCNQSTSCVWEVQISGTTVYLKNNGSTFTTGTNLSSSNFTALYGSWGTTGTFPATYTVELTGDFDSSAPTLNVNYTLLPSIPTDVSATQNTTSNYNTVDLTWNQGTGGSNPTSYTVYRDGSSIGTVTSTTPVSTTLPVSWQNASGGISINGNTITKSGNSWGNGVQGTNTFTSSQGGEVVFNVSSTNQHSMVGFGKDPFVASSSDIQYVLYPASNGTLCFYENNVQLSSLCNSVSYSTTDDLKVKMDSNGVVTYWKNNTLLYTSTLTASGTYYVQATLYSSGVAVTADVTIPIDVLDTNFTDSNAPHSSNLSYTVSGTNTVGTSSQSTAGLIETFYVPNQVVNVTNQGANTPLVLDWDIPTVPSVTNTVTTTYTDTLGASVDGTNNGATTGVTGKIGNGWDFDGTTSSVDLGTSMISHLNSFSFFTWIQSDLSSNQFIMGSEKGANDGIRFIVRPTAIDINLDDSGSSFPAVGSTTHGYSANTWHHVGFTWDGTSLKMYSDGSQLGVTGTGTYSPFTSTDLLLGQRPNTGYSPTFNGVMDEVVFYNKALTTSEISALYNSGNGDSTPDPSGLLAHYDFEDTGNTLSNTPSILDSSSDIQDDFTGYSTSTGDGNYPSSNTAKYYIDTTNDSWNTENISRQSSVEGQSKDLGVTLGDDWMLRFSHTTDNASFSGSGSVAKAFVLSDSDHTAGFGSTNDIGFYTYYTPSPNFGLREYSSGSANSVYLTNPPATGVTHYFEMIKTGSTVTLNQYSDSNYSTLIQSINLTTSSTGQSYLKNMIGFTTSSSVGSGDIDSSIDDIEIWDSEISITSTVTTPSPSLSGYQIERDDGSGFNVIEANHNTNQYSDSTAGGSVVYKISGLNAVGTGTASANHNALAGTPPDPPTGLTSSIQDVNTNPLNVVLNWSSPANVGTGTLSGFEIYRNGSLVTTTGLVTTYTDTVTAGTHSYYLKAVSNHGSSIASNTSNVTTPTVPSSPLNASSVIADVDTAPYDVTVTWETPSSTGGSDLTQYNVYRKQGSGAYSLLTTTTGLTISDTLPSSPSTNFTYKIHSVNNVGESTGFTDTTITTFDVPQAPTLSVTTGTTVLSWNTPTSDGTVTNYKIYRDGSLLTTVGAVNTHSDFTPIVFGNSYDYKVVAVSSLGDGADSNTVTTTPETEITGMVALGVTGTGAVIDWEEPAYYQGQVTSYNVYYGNSGTPTTSAGTTTNTYNNFAPQLDYDTTYVFAVSINSPLGNSGLSNIVTITTNVDGSIVAYDPNTGGMEWFDIDSVSEQTVNVIEFQRETQNLNVNGTFTDVDTLQVGYPSWWDDMTCDVDYKFAQKTEQYVEGDDMTAVVNSADANQQVIGFEFHDIDNEVIEVTCAPQVSQQDDEVSAKYIMTQQNLSTGAPNIPLVTQIQAFQTGDYGTDGEFGALDVVGLFVILISMVGFNRLNPIVGVLLSASLVFGLSFFGIISLPTVLVGVVALVIFLAWGITRNR